MKKDKRIDAYIAKAAPFAKPILKTVRSWVHEGAPDCEETLKWGHPAFVHEEILCGMVAFKEYCGVQTHSIRCQSIPTPYFLLVRSNTSFGGAKPCRW